MYNAIIVDDENTVRRGLKTYFDWAKYNLQVIEDFPDGQKAWQYMQTHTVDLVVTDVRMPNMDGIALAEAVHEAFPSTKIIFISGYDDTEYLRNALKMDAVDYILKSIDLDEFGKTIARVTAKMEQESRRELKLAQMEEQLRESIPLIQQRQLMLLIREEMTNENIAAGRLEFLEIPLSFSTPYCILVMQLRHIWSKLGDSPGQQQVLFSVEVRADCQQILARYNSHVVFENLLGEYVMYVNVASDDYEEVLLSISEELRARMREHYDFDCRIGISNRFVGLQHSHDAYERAVGAIHKRYYSDETQTVSVDKYEETVTTRSMQEWAEKSISEALMSGDLQRIRQCAAELFEKLDALTGEYEKQNLMLGFLMLPTTVLSNVRPGERGSYDNHRALVERYLHCGGLHEQKLFLLGLYEEVSSIINRRSETHSHHIVERVQALIEQQYMEQISIVSLAEEVHLTPTYLCVLFKQATGQTINEYITKTRIQQAKRLLATPHIKLYDVCFRVGYLSPSYFSKIFKKQTLLTPSEYREAALQGK